MDEHCWTFFWKSNDRLYNICFEIVQNSPTGDRAYTIYICRTKVGESTFPVDGQGETNDGENKTLPHEKPAFSKQLKQNRGWGHNDTLLLSHSWGHNFTLFLSHSWGHNDILLLSPSWGHKILCFYLTVGDILFLTVRDFLILW